MVRSDKQLLSSCAIKRKTVGMYLNDLCSDEMMKVLRVDNLFTRNLSRNLSRYVSCEQVVYKENFHHFMTTGATKKSLKTYERERARGCLA